MARGAQLITIFWRDIPAQVNAKSRGEKHQVLLKPRFQKAIDKAAMVAEITTASEYVHEWRQESSPLSGEPEAAAQTEAHRIEDAFPASRLDEIIAAGGFDPEAANGQAVQQPDVQQPDAQQPDAREQHVQESGEPQ